MSKIPTLQRPPSMPPEKRLLGSRNRRIAFVVALVVVAVAAAMIAVFPFDLFGAGDTDTGTPVVEPDDRLPDRRDDAAPDDRIAEPTSAPSLRYEEEPRANWDVTGVAAGDVLNVRAGPGTTFGVMGTLAHDAAEFESTGRIAHVGDQLWREIIVPGDGVGWVNAAYLTPTG